MSSFSNMIQVVIWINWNKLNENLLLMTVLYFQRQDARIIVGLFYEDMARRVFCEVSLQGYLLWFICMLKNDQETKYIHDDGSLNYSRVWMHLGL